MENHRKQAIVCGSDDAFIGALKLLLADFEVQGVSRLADVPSEPDIVIYQADRDQPIGHLSRTASSIPTLVLADQDLLIDAVEANCRGFLPASASLEQIREAVETILDGGAVVPSDLLGSVLRHIVDRRRNEKGILDLEILTNREKDVFRLAVSGARKDEIGEKLFISPDTARTHLQRVYRKLGVHSHAELVALAARTGQINEEDHR